MEQMTNEEFKRITRMDARHFFEAVAAMREVQREYLDTKSSKLYTRLFEKQKIVDDEIRRVQNILKQQEQ